jgi:hypothetical protein
MPQALELTRAGNRSLRAPGAVDLPYTGGAGVNVERGNERRAMNQSRGPSGRDV